MARIGAIVIAAGKSERMGRPKALLKIHAHTFLENILNAISHSKAAHTVVVLGHHRGKIVESLHLENAVFNPVYEQGMITSIQAGIRSLHEGLDGALLFLVDHPIIAAETIDTLIDNFIPGRITLPKFEGRRGHPVLFAANVLEEILALPTSTGANAVLWKDLSRVQEIVVKDRGVTIDIDTPEDYQNLISED